MDDLRRTADNMAQNVRQARDALAGGVNAIADYASQYRNTHLDPVCTERMPVLADLADQAAQAMAERAQHATLRVRGRSPVRRSEGYQRAVPACGVAVGD